MKNIYTILFLVSFIKTSFSQYYYRGEILDENKTLISNTKIYLHSTKVLVDAGSSGSFGIMSTKPKTDTFTIKSEGYESITVPVYADKYNVINIKSFSSASSIQKNRLTSKTKDLINSQKARIHTNGETYTESVENDFVETSLYPETGVSVNTDKASYSNVRRFINMKSEVPTDAIRIDEMINYFNFQTPLPTENQVFNVSSQITQCPWNTNNMLMFVNIAAKKLNLEKLPASNFVFLIDNSGSMELQNRMPLLKASFKMLVNNLRDKDIISIITYGGHVNILLQPISGKYKDSINNVIESMEPEGDTPGESAITLAYKLAKQNFIKDGNNRIILATDGDFNVGISNEEDLEKFIAFQSKTGIYLTCLGLGMGNYKDSKLAALAKKGNGNFAYIDNVVEGEKVLVKELTQTLYSVADNTFIDVVFNKEYINKYRLIGFDNKKNALSDENSTLEGGQVGSGFSTIILFELELTNNINHKNLSVNLDIDYANIQINYQNVQNKHIDKIEYNCKFNFLPILALPKQYGFATSVAMFGAYLKESKYFGLLNLDDIQTLAKQSLEENNKLQIEFLQLIEKSKNIYEQNKKKKKNIFGFY